MKQGRLRVTIWDAVANDLDSTSYFPANVEIFTGNYSKQARRVRVIYSPLQARLLSVYIICKARD
jgi:hypothetical protein